MTEFPSTSCNLREEVRSCSNKGKRRKPNLAIAGDLVIASKVESLTSTRRRFQRSRLNAWDVIGSDVDLHSARLPARRTWIGSKQPAQRCSDLTLCAVDSRPSGTLQMKSRFTVSRTCEPGVPCCCSWGQKGNSGSLEPRGESCAANGDSC